MITLFRRIRQKLIDSGSVSKYLLYAIGEILLVVIGILIALQVNNWNEQRIKLSEEKYFLENLIENVVSDSALVQNLLIDQTEKIASMDTALYMMDNAEAFVASEFSEHLNDMIGFANFTSNRTTYDNLIASGKISYIGNQQLVNALFTYYDPGSVYLFWDDAMKHYSRNNFGPFILKNYNLTSTGVNAGSINEHYANMTKPVYSYKTYRGDQELLNNLNMKYRLVTGQQEMYLNTLVPMQKELLQLLRSSYNNL